MALFNYASKEITLKVVYYGPGLSGKTTNLKYLHDTMSADKKGKLLSLSTEADRTLFFDFMPVALGKIKDFNIRFQLYTVPGQVRYNATRKLVLKGADAIVFVADSQTAMKSQNIDSIENMKENLLANNIKPNSIPLLIQFNKRDLKNILSIEELNADINPDGHPTTESAAVDGTGVMESFKLITNMLLKHISKKHNINIEPPDDMTTPAEPVYEEVERRKEVALVSPRDQSESFTEEVFAQALEEDPETADAAETFEWGDLLEDSGGEPHKASKPAPKATSKADTEAYEDTVMAEAVDEPVTAEAFDEATLIVEDAGEDEGESAFAGSMDDKLSINPFDDDDESSFKAPMDEKISVNPFDDDGQQPVAAESFDDTMALDALQEGGDFGQEGPSAEDTMDGTISLEGLEGLGREAEETMAGPSPADTMDEALSFDPMEEKFTIGEEAPEVSMDDSFDGEPAQEYDAGEDLSFGADSGSMQSAQPVSGLSAGKLEALAEKVAASTESVASALGAITGDDSALSEIRSTLGSTNDLLSNILHEASAEKGRQEEILRTLKTNEKLLKVIAKMVMEDRESPKAKKSGIKIFGRK